MEPSSSSAAAAAPTVMQVVYPTEFYDSLKEEIDNLETMLQTSENNFMSVKFLEEVLFQTRYCHDQMTHWALKLKLEAKGTWFDEYMAESEKIMNFTKDIKASIEGMMRYYVGCIDVTKFLDTKRVLDPLDVQQMITAIKDCKQAAEALEENNIPIATNWKNLRQLEVVNTETSLYGNLGFNAIIYATRNVSKTLLRILLYGFVYCLPQYKFDSYVHQGGKYFDSAFMASIDKLQLSVESEIYKLPKRTGILWYEFRESKVALDKLLIEFGRLSEGDIGFGRLLEGDGDVDLESEAVINEMVVKLKSCIEVLKEGSESILVQIDDLTDEMTEGRAKIKTNSSA